MENTLFSLLRNKEIIAVLDGDLELGITSINGKEYRIAMPYLSGKAICDIAQLFGIPMTYNGNFGPSRWNYMDSLIQNAISSNRISDLLAFMFAKERFEKSIDADDARTVTDVYENIKSLVIEKINALLSFGGNKLSVVGNRFIISKADEVVVVNVPAIKTVDRSYIKDMTDRAHANIDNGYYDSAITQSRTLLEEVFCYVLEKKGIEPVTSGDMNALFKQVKSSYNMHSDPNTDRRILSLLTGLNGITNSIAEMRNKDSDAHGVGSARIEIRDYHARVYVNAAMTMADFILSVEQNANSK